MIERSQLRPEGFIFNRKRVHFRPEVPFSRAPFQAWNGRLWYWERYDRLLSRYELADILVHILCVTFSNTTKKKTQRFFGTCLLIGFIQWTKFSISLEVKSSHQVTSHSRDTRCPFTIFAIAPLLPFFKESIKLHDCIPPQVLTNIPWNTDIDGL